jgi:SWI/SNF-related matrix-associated actin-dependent regulator 1 of chromatin subfamily A
VFKLKPTTELTKEQDDFLVRFIPQKVIGCFDLPGLGKSLEILASICAVLKDGQKALVVVPPHLMANWKHEVEKFTYLEIGKDIDLYPYTQLGKKLTSFQGYSFVAGDEAHYLKNLDAKRTQLFMTYLDAAIPQWFIYATGTPLTNRIPEAYTFLLMLSGFAHVSPKIDVLYPTYYQFCERFCHVKTVSYGSGVKYHGKKNMDELREYMKPWTIRRAPNLSVKMANQSVIADYKDDKQLAKAFEDHASDGEIGGIDIVAKKLAAVAKAPFTAKWVHDELENESGPIVVFSDHREPVEIIAADLKSCSWRVESIMGGDSMVRRAAVIEAFQRGEIDALILTVGAGSTGNTLTKSNLVVFNDIPWVPANLEQARKRIFRLSQERNCRCVYIVGSKADDQIITMIKAKLKVINAVLEA